MLSRKSWWNKEEILAVGATRVSTHARGPLQKETATNRLTTSHRIRAVSGRNKEGIMEDPVEEERTFPYMHPKASEGRIVIRFN